MNKLALTLGLTLTLAPTLFFSCQVSQAKTAQYPTSYLVHLPIQRQVTKLIELEGEFRSPKYTQILAEHSGKITAIHARDGDYVDQGQPIVEFDSTLAELAVKTAQNEYQIATRNIIELTRTSREDDPKLKTAARAVQETRNNLLLAQQDLNATTMYAPFSGTLGQIRFNAGNYVNEGDFIADLVATDRVELHFDASPQVLNVFRQVLSNYPDSLNASILSPEGQYIDGKLRYVDSKIANQAQQLSAYAVFDNQNGEHLIGSKTAFYLNSPKQEPQLFVPASAIHTDDGTPTLFVLDEKRIVRAKQVTLATIKETVSGYTPIKSGLVASDFVLSSPDAPHLVGKKIEPVVNIVNQLNEILNRGN